MISRGTEEVAYCCLAFQTLRVFSAPNQEIKELPSDLCGVLFCIYGIYGSYTPATVDQNELNSRWFMEPGLYRLIFKSQMPFATEFEDWVTEWLVQQALGGQGINEAQNASLQQLISGAFGQTRRRLYGIAGNLINQAVLGFQETTKQFKQRQQVPAQISIPDLLDMQGQVARCYAETCFQKFITDNLQRLRDMPGTELIQEFEGLKVNMRQGFVLTGMSDLQTKMLTIGEAQKRKKEQISQARKRQKLLQAEQPRAIGCAV